MSNIQQLRPRDVAVVDQLAIRALFSRLGPLDAEACIMADMTELTDLMRRMDHDVSVNAFAAVSMQANRAKCLSRELGFVALTNVFGAIIEICVAADPIALAATWERAKRIGDKSFVDLWELPMLRM